MRGVSNKFFLIVPGRVNKAVFGDAFLVFSEKSLVTINDGVTENTPFLKTFFIY